LFGYLIRWLEWLIMCYLSSITTISLEFVLNHTDLISYICKVGRITYLCPGCASFGDWSLYHISISGLVSRHTTSVSPIQISASFLMFILSGRGLSRLFMKLLILIYLVWGQISLVCVRSISRSSLILLTIGLVLYCRWIIEFILIINIIFP